jgi:hypothetical protein
MPELDVPGAYPIALTLMGGMIAGTLYYFHCRGWLRRNPISAADVPVLDRKPGGDSARRIVLPDADLESAVHDRAA